MKHFLHLNDFSKQEIIHIFELADKLKANNEECDRISWKLGGYDYCPSQGFVVVRVYGGAFAYSNY